MTSPIAFLDRHVLMSMRNVAPEKEAELEAAFNKHGISFEIDTADHRKGFSADLARKVIIVRRPRLERLWATAFAYYRFYREVSQQKQNDVSIREIDLTSTEALCEAGRLLKWAVEADIQIANGEAPAPWPDDLPRPSDSDEKLSDENCATELFLAATGFTLHHELAHITLDHQPYNALDSVDAIRQEKDADFAAADWLLDGLDDESDFRFQKRALGVCLGLVSLASLHFHVYLGPASTETHPPAYDRLFQVVSRHVADPGNLPWAFVMTVLSLHLQNQRIEHDQDRQFESFKDAADYFIDVISKLYE